MFVGHNPRRTIVWRLSKMRPSQPQEHDASNPSSVPLCGVCLRCVPASRRSMMQPLCGVCLRCVPASRRSMMQPLCGVCLRCVPASRRSMMQATHHAGRVGSDIAMHNSLSRGSPHPPFSLTAALPGLRSEEVSTLSAAGKRSALLSVALIESTCALGSHIFAEKCIPHVPAKEEQLHVSDRTCTNICDRRNQRKRRTCVKRARVRQ
jgi:hypothetical protein